MLGLRDYVNKNDGRFRPTILGRRLVDRRLEVRDQAVERGLRDLDLRLAEPVPVHLARHQVAARWTDSASPTR